MEGNRGEVVRRGPVCAGSPGEPQCEEPRAEFKAQRFATVEDVAEAVLRGFAAADGRRRAPGWWRARPSTGAATSAMSAANER